MRNLFFDLVIAAYLIGSVSAAETSLVINEFMASNSSYVQDPQGQNDDWIEIHNFGSNPINVGGMYLTDNLLAPTKWRIPDNNPPVTIIPAGGYLLIWADEDMTDTGFHANFKLDAAGEQIGLIDSDGVTVIDSVIFGEQETDTSFGRYPDAGDDWLVFNIPSPRAGNISVFRGVVSGAEVSHDRGFYDTSFSLTLASETNGAIIYYTLDGTEPYEFRSQIVRGMLYTAPVTISGTTCLRAVATKPGFKPSDIMTQTYIFPGDVVRQSPSGQRPGPTWPSGSVNGQVFDYGMDPDVVNDPRYSAQMRDALLAIPSISLVTNLENLFDRSKGIYVNASREGRSWERPVSVELLNPDGSEGFQIDAGIRIRGGFSRTGNNPKHSFRLFFRGEYGQSKLRFPLFGDEGIDEFDNLDLRTAQNYAWSLTSSNPGRKNTFIREVFCRDIQREMGQPYTRSRYYQLYINGQYWGLYQSQERSEASYAEAYFGGGKENYDVIKADNYQTSYTDGSMDDWNALWRMCRDGFETDAAYYAALGKNANGADNPDLPVHVDLENLIDYMLGILFTGNDDAPVTLGGNQANNFFCIRDRRLDARSGWKSFAYDNEHSLGVARGLNDDRTGPVSAGQSMQHFNPQWLHQKLMAHPEYRMYFADRAHKYFFNNGALTPENTIALCLKRASEIDLAIIGESARWGDQRSDRRNNPYTKADWWAEVNGYLINTFFPARSQIVLGQLKNRGLYPQVDAPAFQINGTYRHGGHVAANARLSMTGSGGTIWYTLDGSDPRLPGTVSEVTEKTTLIHENASKR
ncbi:MAG: CotH kinase family protein, partial [Planctomycetota bacterium]